MERLDSLLDLGRGRSIACRDLILVRLFPNVDQWQDDKLK